MVHNPLVDLQELIIDYLQNSALRKRKFPNYDKITSADISWLHVQIRHDDAVYTSTGEVSRPSSSILFSSTFENSTDNSQVYNLKTERTTHSTCTYTVTKGYCVNGKIGIKVTAPIIGIVAGIDSKMTIENANECTFMQTMVWSVDNQVSVASGYRTKADLMILEKEYEANFTSAIHYSGNLNIVLHHKGSAGTLTVNVTDVFNEENGFVVDKDVATYICEGSCKCRYGIEQSVKLTQERILDSPNEVDS